MRKATETPPTADEGLLMLDSLKNKLSSKEQEERQELFDKAERFIKTAGENKGVSAQVSKTFLKKSTRDVRIDIEVIMGIAFVSMVIILMVIYL